MRRRRSAASRLVLALPVVVVLVVVAAAGCSSDPPVASNAIPPPAVAGERVVFVALGGDETLNRGLDDSLRNSWTQRVFVGLPRSAVYVNLASEDAPVADGLARQVPKALELQATIATVWFGSGDAREHNTSAGRFAADLTSVVQQLRAGGVGRVLLLSRTSSGARGGSRYVEQVKQVAQQAGVTFIDVPGSSNNPGDPGSQEAVAAAVKAQLYP